MSVTKLSPILQIMSIMSSSILSVALAYFAEVLFFLPSGRQLWTAVLKKKKNVTIGNSSTKFIYFTIEYRYFLNITDGVHEMK